MKHLKRFNEELSPSTYRSAAWKLSNMARKTGNDEFKIRSNNIRDYAEDKAWKENIKEYSKFGKTTVTTQYNKKGDTVTGDFYLNFLFDDYAYEDMVQDYLAEEKLNVVFSVGLIPVDIETKEKFQNVIPEGDFDNGFFWGFWVEVEFEDKGEGLEFSKVSVSSYDFSITGKLSFSRSLCGAIKRHLSACFTEDSGYEQNGRSLYKILQEEVLIKSGASLKYGVAMQDLQEFIKEITPNTIMSSVDDRQTW
jgi:hypothetical protein